jgi:hypothetical protein
MKIVAMKKLLTLFFIFTGCISFIAIFSNEDDPVPIPASKQRLGSADSGFQYLVTGDYVNSGMPVSIYHLLFKKENRDWLDRGGENGKVRYDFNVVKAKNGETIVVPNCLQCHAGIFDGKLVIGLGNSTADFTEDQKLNSKFLEKMVAGYMKLHPKKYEAARELMEVYQTIGGELYTETPGANPADKLAALLIAHRDKETLAWNPKATIGIPKEVVPTDVPAWWLLKKKNAMFYNGFGRGDFGKFLMGSALLTTSDTFHAAEVDSHMPDLLSYIYSIQPPKYPFAVDEKLVKYGKEIFEATCSRCHGTYGSNGQYPNLLIPQSVIRTDSFLNKSNYQLSELLDWYNQSWFSKGEYPAKLVPFNGYVAPPLDGVWITAPYLHNGSVPTVEAVLNSQLRPTYWARSFDSTKYDYEKLGWEFRSLPAPGDKHVYNTTLPGYGNYGHYFGDQLSDVERRAVIEYLKKL